MSLLKQNEKEANLIVASLANVVLQIKELSEQLNKVVQDK